MQKLTESMFLLSFPPLLSFSSLSPPSLTIPLSFPFKGDPLNHLGSLAECYKLPQWGPGQSPSQKRIWCTPELLETNGGNCLGYSEVHVLQ